jgi:acyl carrier protein
MNDVKSQVKEYIEENFLLSAGARMPADSDSFMDHQLLDSTGFLELVLFLEERFEISVEDSEMIPENLDSMDALAAFVKRKHEGFEV